MNEPRRDPILEKWLSDGPDQGPEHGLNRALAATQKVAQRPGWTFPRWWLPSPVAEVELGVPRSLALAAVLVLTLALLIALAAAFGNRNAPLILSPSENVIAFSEGGAIYVANPDGTNKRNLNLGVTGASAPGFSPDGSRIAFVAGGTLHIATVDGSSPRLVDASHSMVVADSDLPNYSWSSDGKELAMSVVDGGVATIYVVDREGENFQSLTDGTKHSDLPSWGPASAMNNMYSRSGEWIAYRVTDLGASQRSFERVHPDGTGMEVMAAVIGPDSYLGKLSWSPPDAADAGSFSTSYAMNVGFGTDTRAVIDGGVGHALDIWTDGLGGYAAAPIPWSSDSRYLAFIKSDGAVVLADDDRTFDIYDGQFRDIGPVLGCWVDWSPDNQFLYGAAPNGCQGIAVVPLAHPGSAVTLTTEPGTASWRSVP